MSRQWEFCALTSHAAIVDDEHDEPHTAAGPFLYEPAAPGVAPPAGSFPVARRHWRAARAVRVETNESAR